MYIIICVRKRVINVQFQKREKERSSGLQKSITMKSHSHVLPLQQQHRHTSPLPPQWNLPNLDISSSTSTVVGY
jgi:hypothetical protein